MSVVVVPLQKEKHPKAEVTNRKPMHCLYHPTPKTDISNQSSTIPPQSLDLPLKPFLTEYSSQPLPFNWH